MSKCLQNYYLLNCFIAESESNCGVEVNVWAPYHNDSDVYVPPPTDAEEEGI